MPAPTSAPTRTAELLRRLGFGVQLLGVLGYLVVEQIVAAAWPPPGYSFRDNYVSDLGVPICSMTNRWVCSPRHDLMNTTFQVVGVAALIGAISLAASFRGVRRAVTAVLGFAHSVGLVLVGIAPGSFAEDITDDRVQMVLHSWGALLAILGTAVHALVQGLWSWRSDRRFAVGSLLLGAITPVLLVLAPLTGRADLGLGRGTFERAGVYAALGWLAFVAVVGLVRGGSAVVSQEPAAARQRG